MEAFQGVIDDGRGFRVRLDGAADAIGQQAARALVAALCVDQRGKEMVDFFLSRSVLLQDGDHGTTSTLGVVVEGFDEQAAFVTKGVVDTLAADPESILEIADTRAIVSLLPEQLHRLFQGMVFIKMFRASRHRVVRLGRQSSWFDRSVKYKLNERSKNGLRGK